MAVKPLRLLHAANLQLDCPLRDTGVLHDEIREIVESATLIAFDRIVTLAIEKDVDALLITGNTFDVNYASLAAEVAMRDGFTRLAERQIPVFVTPGRIDPAAAWVDLPRLPDNVTLFIDAQEPPVDLTDHGRLLASLIPVTSDSSVNEDEITSMLQGRSKKKPERRFIVGLFVPNQAGEPNHRFKLNPSRFNGIDWLACPAGTDPESVPHHDGQVHAQTAPQGMSLFETGARGVTLVEVDSQLTARQTLMPLAPVRWERMTQLIDNVKGRDDLLERMLAQLERLPSIKGELLRIIDWHLDRNAGDANGWELESAAHELGEALTEFSDQADGLRYVHRVHALEPDLTLIEPAHREVLTEFLLAIGRRGPINHGQFEKWLSDARVADALHAGRWEHWTESITAEQVIDRSRQLGWKWFTTVGKK